MLKIGENWGKIANYPPNALHKSAPLSIGNNLCIVSEDLSSQVLLFCLHVIDW